MKRAAAGFMVVYDDGMLLIPATWSDEQEGAIYFGLTNGVAMFDTRQAARRSILISTKYNEMLKAQGNPCNEDFTDPKFRKNIKIVPVTKEQA